MKNRIIILVLGFLFISCTNEIGNLLDIDGNEYAIKSYHGTVWMTENLKVIHDIKGDTIKYYFPNNDTNNVQDYGLLYDYKTACKICPNGWELPTNEDWEKLFVTLENSAPDFKDVEFWKDKSNTNSSLFSVRPAGYENTEFDNFFNSKALFWSKTDTSDHFIWTYIFEEDSNNIRRASQHPTYAFSVRCIKKKN